MSWCHELISFIAKAVSDIKAKTSCVKLLSVLFDFRTFCSFVHSHKKENQRLDLSLHFYSPTDCFVYLCNCLYDGRVAEIKLQAFETRSIVATHDVSFVLKCVLVCSHKLTHTLFFR